MKGLLLSLLALLIIGGDALLKWAVASHLPLASLVHTGYPYGGVGVIENFLGVQASIIHATNTGAIWGIFSSYTVGLLLVRLALIGGLVGYLLIKRLPLAIEIPLVMIVAGAVGNVCDIFFYGHVVDMFYFVLWGWSYPVFNLADAAIFVGIASLAIYSLFFQKRKGARVAKD